MQRLLIALAAALAAPVLLPADAAARVAAQSEQGFVLQQVADVPATPEEAWAQLVRPSGWWSVQHSYSRDAANFSLDARPGGCFCETLPGGDDPEAPPRGGVEHMRVVYVERPRVLRMRGALGPLQRDALNGTMTVILQPVDGGTRILWEYAVSGFMRGRPQDVAVAVDLVIAEQLGSLARLLGAKPGAGPLPAGPADGADAPDGDNPQTPPIAPLPDSDDPLSDPNFLGR